MTKLNTFKVKYGNKEMQVIIPDTGDRAENAYLEEAEREKTLEQLRKKPPREETKLSKDEQADAIKEYSIFRRRRAQNNIRRYF